MRYFIEIIEFGDYGDPIVTCQDYDDKLRAIKDYTDLHWCADMDYDTNSFLYEVDDDKITLIGTHISNQELLELCPEEWVKGLVEIELVRVREQAEANNYGE